VKKNVMRLFALLFACQLTSAVAQQWGGELRFAMRSDPKTFDPAAVADDASETIRYLTGGVLVRVNRKTQLLEPELATSWRVTQGGKRITFELRQGVRFSDGAVFTADHVALTMKRLMDPARASPTGDAFRSGPGEIKVDVHSATRVSITFPSAIAGLARLFDQVAILKSAPAGYAFPVLGPFRVSSYRAGRDIVLARNPSFWKTAPNGRRLPYVDAIRIVIQQNRDLEFDRFLRGELDLINSLEPTHFKQLQNLKRTTAFDAGPSLESEMMWFNQVPTAPLPDFKQNWFRSTVFRRAISEAVNREDICRLVYAGYAQPAAGPVSRANKFWYAEGLTPHTFDPRGALARLEREGFRLSDKQLYDRAGNRVEFSVITNSGNTVRIKIAAMMQQDLARLGIRMTIVQLDFPSLLARITKSFEYDACLLGLVNLDLDPNSQMNVWLSSASNHQWNPAQKRPGTGWEAEIDKLMLQQASATDEKARRTAFAAVQRIVSEHVPFLYIANHNALCAISDRIRNAEPVPLTPRTYWNAEWLWVTQ
jgi:peptide/nickel transport system substrate-binding protein